MTHETPRTDIIEAVNQVQRTARERAENQIFEILRELEKGTGFEVSAVDVKVIVDTVRGEPRRRVFAVRIDLCV